MNAQKDARTRRENCGFTMIEMIVALAMIAVLMALMIAALAMSRENARRVLCMHQLKQLGYQTHNYIDANRERSGDKGALPPFLFSFEPGNSNTLVVLVVPKRAVVSGWDNYDKRLMVCPTDENPGYVGVMNEQGGRDLWKCSYGYNIDMILRKINYWKLGAPSRTALFFDGTMSGPGDNPGGGKSVQGHYFNTRDYANSTMRLRHRVNKANVLFMDWHVETLAELTDDQIYVDGYDMLGMGNGNGGNGGGGGGSGGNGGGNGGGSGGGDGGGSGGGSGGGDGGGSGGSSGGGNGGGSGGGNGGGNGNGNGK